MGTSGTNKRNSILRRPVLRAKILSSVLTICAILLLFGGGFFSLWQDKLTDLLFTNKNPDKNIVLVGIDETSLQAIGAWPWKRSIFGDILPRLSNAKVVAYDINFKDISRYGGEDDDLFAESFKNSSVPIVLSSEISQSGPMLPLTKFSNTTDNGYTNLVVSPDNVVRYIKFGDSGYKSFSLKIAEFSRSNESQIGLNSKPLHIFFFGKEGTYPSFSFIDVLEGKIPPQFFEGKTVIIGATAPDLQDFRSTPVGIMSGVEIQANAVGTVLSNRFLSDKPIITAILIILFGAFCSIVIFKSGRASLSVLFIIALFVFYNLTAFLLFDHLILLDLFFPNMTIVVSSAVAFLVEHRFAVKEKRFIRDSFSRYLSPHVIEDLVKSPENLKLGGEKRLITILFSDIRGFTSLSENMTPDELVHFLNRYLTLMSDIVMSNGGLIDKYIGDAIMAFWGAPLENHNQAGDAVDAARGMGEALDKFNEENQKLGLPKIDIGIGINTGEATVGNLGSEKRFDYTAMGDAVNLSSRLESLTKQYGARIILSESTVQKIKEVSEDAKVREIDRVRVKGKKEAVKIFELKPNSQTFESGLNAYYAGDWENAKKHFEAALFENPADGPAKTLLERVQEFLKSPPVDWDGVYTLKSK